MARAEGSKREASEVSEGQAAGGQGLGKVEPLDYVGLAGPGPPESLAEGRGVAAAIRAEEARVGVAAVGMRKDSDVGVGIFENQLTKLVLGNIKKWQNRLQVVGSQRIDGWVRRTCLVGK